MGRLDAGTSREHSCERAVARGWHYLQAVKAVVYAAYSLRGSPDPLVWGRFVGDRGGFAVAQRMRKDGLCAHAIANQHRSIDRGHRFDRTAEAHRYVATEQATGVGILIGRGV